MRKSRFTTEQIVGVLREAEAGGKISELCRRHAITETTFHRWRRKYGGLHIPEARRLKALEEENRQLKRLVNHNTARPHSSLGDLTPAEYAANWSSLTPVD